MVSVVASRWAAGLAALVCGLFGFFLANSAAPGLLADLGRVRAWLAAVRLRYANLVAAGRATLFAHANGGRDPLAYLRDELPRHRPASRHEPQLALVRAHSVVTSAKAIMNDVELV
jgi:hypothetical protein